jgi:excinuclease UvrABC nuclease subunit
MVITAPKRGAEQLRHKIDFLAGLGINTRLLSLDELRERMERASQRTRFEEATTLRNRLEAIQEVVSGRSVPEGCPADADVFAVVRDAGSSSENIQQQTA